MSHATFSKHKVVFFVVLFVVHILLTLSDFFIGDTLGIGRILLIIRVISVVPVLALLTNKRGFAISLIVMLIINILLVRTLNVFQAIVDFGNAQYLGPGVIFLLYSIIRFFLSVFVLIAVILLSFNQKTARENSKNRTLAMLGIVAATLLMLFSFSFSYSPSEGWIKIISIVSTFINAIVFSTIFIVYFSGFLSKSDVVIPVNESSEHLDNKRSEVKTKIEPKVYVPSDESRFTGTTFGLVWLNIWTNIVTGITLGLAFPFMLCTKEKWLARHTYINGHQLHFDGNGMQLFGNWIKWSLLTLITLGIYAFFIPIAIKKWTISHLKLVD